MVVHVATEQAELDTTGVSSLTRMSTRRSLGVGAIIIAAAIVATFLAISIVSAFG
jgi:hypothetical protein